MKKLFALILALVMCLGLCACSATKKSDKPVPDKPTTNDFEIREDKTLAENKDDKASAENKDDTVDESYPDSLEALEETINKEVEKTIDSLKNDYENLELEIDTYEKYKANTEKVEAFYEKVLSSQQELTIKLRKYALAYADIILSSDIDNDERYDQIEGLYDIIYDDAGDEIYDEIYSGIMDDLYDLFYSGILDDAYDRVEYSEWSDLSSDEYDLWSDTQSDVYDDWSDFQSDIYDFWSDMSSDLWDDDLEKAMKTRDDFKEDIDKL